MTIKTKVHHGPPVVLFPPDNRWADPFCRPLDPQVASNSGLQPARDRRGAEAYGLSSQKLSEMAEDFDRRRGLNVGRCMRACLAGFSQLTVLKWSLVEMLLFFFGSHGLGSLLQEVEPVRQGVPMASLILRYSHARFGCGMRHARRYIRSGRLRGAVVAVMRGGEVVAVWELGSFTKQTVFKLYSITKAMENGENDGKPTLKSRTPARQNSQKGRKGGKRCV